MFYSSPTHVHAAGTASERTFASGQPTYIIIYLNPAARPIKTKQTHRQKNKKTDTQNKKYGDDRHNKTP